MDESDRQDAADGIAAGVEGLNGVDLVAHRRQVSWWVVEDERDHPNLGGLLSVTELGPKFVRDPGLSIRHEDQVGGANGRAVFAVHPWHFSNREVEVGPAADERAQPRA